jgi:Ca-activated chloride channel family protein
MNTRFYALTILAVALMLLLGSAFATDRPQFPEQVTVPRPTMPPPDMPLVVPPRGVFTDPAWLSVDFHRVQVDIDNRVATTSIDLQFTNTGEGLVEGTYLFPLPPNAAIDRLTMIIDGVPYDAKILSADEARSIYNEIVRQYRDPALLEYVGYQAVQANVFPIPPGETRRIQIDYAHLLDVQNGLVQYSYPNTTKRFVDSMSVSVSVHDNAPIGTVYSPTHSVAVSRSGRNGFTAGYESSNVVEAADFTLYYGLDTSEINLNLLTYRESANEDGFFLLLLQPPLAAESERIIPKDVILVLDQSGSMHGDKWTQAQGAAKYVLENLNPEDRFNAIVFSTGYRLYSNEMLGANEAQGAVNWVNGLQAEGGTNINEALLQALALTGERPTTILFMTDGEATEGVTETQQILANLQAAAKPNARIFTFGVGDDVNTLLLDALTKAFSGAVTYVRPTQRIDESVEALFNKISAPVLTDARLTFDGVTVDLQYPNALSDLFAGEQITVAGRFRRGSDAASITLSGMVDGQPRSFTFSDLSFSDRAGGEPFIARLWASRHIADMLNAIRLNGENPELVDSIVRLSIRYGIITPYTSFLIEEDDILTQQGRDRAVMDASQEMNEMAQRQTGSAAVDQASFLDNMARSSAPSVAPMPTMTAASTQVGGVSAPGEAEKDEGQSQNPIQYVGDKTFILQNNVWTDTTFEPDSMETIDVEFLSDAYFDLLEEHPELAEYFALGDALIVVWEGAAYQVTPEA